MANLKLQVPTCDGCGGPLTGRSTWSKFGRFHSNPCRVKFYKRSRVQADKIGRTCDICGTDIQQKRSDAITCGESCKKRRQNRLRSGGG